MFTANFWEGGGGISLGRKKLNGMIELCVYEAQVVDLLTSQRCATPRPSVFEVSGSCLWTLNRTWSKDLPFTRSLPTPQNINAKKCRYALP